MTSDDRIPEASELDEIASAILDGEATAAEAARADEPDVAARIARFAALAGRLAAESAPAVDPTHRDAAIDAALGAFRPAPAPVVAMRRAWPRWLPAAAAVAVLAALGLAVARLGGGDADDSVASGAADRAETSAGALAESAEGTGGDAAVSAPAPAAGGTTASAGAGTGVAVTDLGDLAGAEELAAAARMLLDTTFADDDDRVEDGEDGSAEAADTDPGAVARAAGVACADRFGTSLVTVATARVGGVAVTVGLFHDESARSYIALDQATCEPVAADDL